MVTCTEATIARYVKRWVPILGLTHWRLTVRCVEKATRGPLKDSAATCGALPQYEEARLAFHLAYIRQYCMVPEEVEELVLHELVHCVIWCSSERTVTHVTRALLRVQDMERARHG